MHLEIDSSSCTGCRICEAFCSLYHEKAVWPEKARIRILYQDDAGPFFPIVCHQCDDTPCAAACPVEAITIDQRTGAVLVDHEECLYCGDCARACPFEAVFLDEEQELTRICDLCGGEPRCIPTCPKDVIRSVSGAGPGPDAVKHLEAQ